MSMFEPDAECAHCGATERHMCTDPDRLESVAATQRADELAGRYPFPWRAQCKHCHGTISFRGVEWLGSRPGGHDIGQCRARAPRWDGDAQPHEPIAVLSADGEVPADVVDERSPS